MAAAERPVSGERPPWDPETQRKLIEWLSLPREKSAELLGGRIAPKAMATIEHGAAQMGVAGQLLPLQGPRRGEEGPPGGGGRWWLTQEVDLYIGGEGMRPDVAGWRADRHPAPPARDNVDERLGVIVVPPAGTPSTSSPGPGRQSRSRAPRPSRGSRGRDDGNGGPLPARGRQPARPSCSGSRGSDLNPAMAPLR